MSDTDDALERLRRAVLAARRRAAASRVASLIEAEKHLDEAMALAVRDLRRQGLSWTEIGELFGVQRHTSFEKWRHVEAL